MPRRATSGCSTACHPSYGSVFFLQNNTEGSCVFLKVSKVENSVRIEIQGLYSSQPTVMGDFPRTCSGPECFTYVSRKRLFLF